MNNKNGFPKYVIDIIIIIVITLFFLVLTLKLDLFDLLVAYTREHEEYELDELILAFLFLPFPLIWYGYRRYKEYEKLNKELKIRVQKEVQKQLKQEKAIISQSKNAAMGEMIGSIAHQWRQPLNTIATVSSGIKIKTEFDLIEQKELFNNLDTITNLTEYLSTTIDTFRNYLRGEKILERADITDSIRTAINIIKIPLDDSNIKLEHNLDKTKNILVRTIPNELLEVIINIINNAKDAIIQNNIKNGKVSITVERLEDGAKILIEDNGGGIPEEIIDNIFEQYFTTKFKSQGTGLGLYMAHKLLTKSLKGKISVVNIDDGALFTLEIPNLDD